MRPELVDVLLVEDNELDAQLAIHVLSRMEQIEQVIHVRSEEEAVSFLRRQAPRGDAPRPDMILLDLHLGGGSGFDVLREYQASNQSLPIPIVIFSSSRDPADVIESYRLGANAFVRKPDSPDGYAEIIHATVDFWLDVARLPGTGEK